MHALIRIVRQTDAIGIASDETLRPYLQRGELQPLQWRNLPQNLDSLSARCGIISRSGYRLSAAAKAMIGRWWNWTRHATRRPEPPRGFPSSTGVSATPARRAALAHRGEVGGHRRIGQQARHQRRGGGLPAFQVAGEVHAGQHPALRMLLGAGEERIVMLRHQHAQQRGLEVAVHGVAAGIGLPSGGGSTGFTFDVTS